MDLRHQSMALRYRSTNRPLEPQLTDSSVPSQGVYRFNWTNFQEIPGEIQDMFALLRPAMQCTESTTFSGACDDELQPTLITVLFNRLQH